MVYSILTAKLKKALQATQLYNDSFTGVVNNAEVKPSGALHARFAMMAKPGEECMSDQDKVSAMRHDKSLIGQS